MILKNFKVGFNLRPDTYTKKLGFINYQKIDGSWKYKKSYDNWVDSTIPEEEYVNDLQSGFVINNNVGYMSYGDGREPKVRIFDPRGFEIEITMGNFFHIISFGVNSGKELSGSFCYGIVDDRLTLIHESEVVYEESTLRLYEKDEPLVIGNTYYTSLDGKTDKYIYVGEKDCEIVKRNKLVSVTKNVFIRIEQNYIKSVLLDINMNPNKFKTVDTKYQEIVSQEIRLKGGFEHLIGKRLTKVEADLGCGFVMDEYVSDRDLVFLVIGGETYKTYTGNLYNIYQAIETNFDFSNYFVSNLKNLTKISEPIINNKPNGDELQYDEISTNSFDETVKLLRELKTPYNLYIHKYNYKILELINDDIYNKNT